jgi:hypothetical protein
MTEAEHIMFALEKSLQLIDNRDARRIIRDQIHKLNALDLKIIDLHDELEELRQKYSHFDEFLHLIPGMSDEDYDDEEGDDE